jgi:probable O-glycosylation ligase (exosortase A-associated)
MRDLLIASIVFGLLPFILKRPFWGILLMAWLGYMNPHRLCYGFMLTMPVVQIVAITTLIGMLMSKESKRMVWSPEIILLIVFIGWMGITTTQAFFFDAAFTQYIKVIKIQILTFMTLIMLTSQERVRQFVWAIVLSLGFYGVKGGLFTIANGGAYHVQGPSTTFIAGNNELALALVMTLPLMRYLHLHEKSHIVKIGLMVGMILTAIATIGSQSRGALVALTITGAFFWLKGRHKIRTGIFIAGGAVAILSIMPDSWYRRMGTIENFDQDASALGRLNAWSTAWNVATDRFFGGGFEMFQASVFQVYAPEAFRVHDVHSIYFQILGHHGFVGLFMFLGLLALTWARCRSTIRLSKKNPEQAWAGDLAAMIQVSLVGFMTAGAFLGLAYFDYFYHLLALAVVVHHLVKASAAAQSNTAQSALNPTGSVLSRSWGV